MPTDGDAFSQTPPIPRIRLGSGWRYVKGFVLGLRSSALLGPIDVPEGLTPCLASVSRAIQAMTGEPCVNLSAFDVSEQRLHTLAQAVGALQRYAGVYVSTRVYVGQSPDNQTVLGLPTAHPHATQLALNRLIDLVGALSQTGRRASPDMPELRHLVRELASMADPRVNVFMLHQAAEALNIPVFRLSPELDILGSGVRSRWFSSTLTDKTPGIGLLLAQDKQKTAALLRASGLPGGVHRLVKNWEQAREAALHLGFPLVVKPNDRDRGEGVFADMRSMAELEVAFHEASKLSPHVLVEKWAPGFTHRLTVVEGDVVWATRRLAGGVTGDGQKTVSELVEQLQQSADFQRRTVRSAREALSMDDEACSLLARDGRDGAYVPAAGERVRLRRRDNISAGGTNQNLELTGVHPDNLRLAVDAARLLRLDFAGIDLIMEDISRSWLEVGALICEINAKPQLRAGGDTQVYRFILEKLFPNGANVPIQVVVVPDEVAAQPAFAQQESLATPEAIVSASTGLWQAGKRITWPFSDSYQACISVLTRTDCHRARLVLPLSDAVSVGLPTFAVQELRFTAFHPKGPDTLARLREAQWLLAPFFQRKRN